MRYRIALLAVALLTTVLVAAPANAGIYERSKFDNSFSDSITECGIAIDYSWTGRGVFTIRTIAGTDEAYLGSTTVHSVETFTNPDNDKWFTISADGITRETSGTLVEGNIWSFANKDSGAHFTVRSSEGDVLYRDSGTVRYTTYYDTLGDGQPGAIFISDQLDDLNGRFTDVDFCADLVEPLLS